MEKPPNSKLIGLKEETNWFYCQKCSMNTTHNSNKERFWRCVECGMTTFKEDISNVRDLLKGVQT